MSDRVSQIVLLCEDDSHARLVRAYLRICGHETDVRSVVASRMKHGGNVTWVIERFPAELHACRQRQTKANTLLVVVVDADEFSVEYRRQQLFERVGAAAYEQVGDNEPLALLVAKRHVETWIATLLGEVVTEEEDCKQRKPPSKEHIRKAAEVVYSWSRLHAKPAAHCGPSLLSSLPQWRRIC